MNKRSILMLGAISAVAISSTVFGGTYASWVVTDNAKNKTVLISPNAPTYRTITFNVPSGDGSTFTQDTLLVENGSNLYTALSSHTSAVGDYSFVEWHRTNTAFASYSEGYADDKIATSENVTSDMTVYAKYVQSNVGYYWDGSDRYITASTSNIAVNSQKFFYGDRIYSWGGVDGTEVDLSTSSGRYSFTKNASDWSVKRVVGIDVSEISWFTDASARFALWCFEGPSGLSDSWSSLISLSSKKGYAEVDIRYNGFILVRLNNSGNVSWDIKWNQTTNIYRDWDDTSSVSDRHSYTASQSRIYLRGDSYKSGDNYQCVWGNW